MIRQLNDRAIKPTCLNLISNTLHSEISEHVSKDTLRQIKKKSVVGYKKNLIDH